jgi:hypothetical protein
METLSRLLTAPDLENRSHAVPVEGATKVREIKPPGAEPEFAPNAGTICVPPIEVPTETVAVLTVVELNEKL